MNVRDDTELLTLNCYFFCDVNFNSVNKYWSHDCSWITSGWKDLAVGVGMGVGVVSASPNLVIRFLFLLPQKQM